jgi:hypothetical protein
MLIIERNTRGLRDSLAVRFSRKLLCYTIDIFTSDFYWTTGFALPRLSTMLILKGREHRFAGLARQGHVSPSLTVYTIGRRIHRPIVRRSSY